MPANLIFFIDLAARSAIVLAIASAVILALPKLSAAARYWIWLTALCALPLLPLSNAFLPSVTIFDISSEAEVESTASVVPPAVDLVAELPEAKPSTLSAEVSEAHHETAGTIDELAAVEKVAPVAISQPDTGSEKSVTAQWSWSHSVGLLYGLGVGTLLIPLILGLRSLRRLRQGARQLGTDLAERVEASVESLSAREKTGALKILVSDEITIPLTWGTINPVILLPEQAESWSAERLEVVLSHELAHIQRRDFATGIVASLLRAAFWFQPMAWFAHRKLRVEREIACDDLVLRGESSTATDYAQHLSDVVRGADDRLLVAGIAMARPSEIVGRVRAILDSARNRAGISRRAKQRTTLLALVVLAPLAFVRCTGEKNGTAGDEFETGNGIVMKEIDPKGITLEIDGEEVEVPEVSAPFHMAIHEVTQSEFQEVLGHNPSSTKAAHLPVDRVTRTEAASFCKVLTERDRAAGVLPKGKIYRLPTRREWLIAGIPSGLVRKGDSLEAIAWHQGNSAGLLHPVGAKEANAYGLHDMVGNAAEWTDYDEGLAEEMVKKSRGTFLGKTVLQLHNPDADPVFAEEGKQIDHKTFLQTQFAIIESRNVLLSVVTELDLSKRWSLDNPDEAVVRLKRNLRVQPIRGTELVELKFYGTDGKEAAEIANEIAASYKQRVTEYASEIAEREIGELELETKHQEKIVNESRDAMLELMKESNIVDLGSGAPSWMGERTENGTGTIVVNGEDKVTKGDDLIKTKKNRLENLRNTVEELSGLEGDELVDKAIDHELDPALEASRLVVDQGERSVESNLASGLGEEHPKIQALKRSNEMLKKLLMDNVTKKREDLSTQVSKLEKEVEKLEKERKTMLEDAMDEKRRSIEYLAARDEYQMHKALLTELKQRIATQKVNLKMPRHTVTIHEKAVPLVVTKGVAGTPVAIGGTAFDNPEDLLERTSASGDDERADGVGFRFVMADG